MRMVIACVAIVVVGCGGNSGQPKLYPVSGTILWNGKPVTQIDIVLIPEDPASGTQPCKGTTDRTGKFNILTKSWLGATEGSYKVVLSTGPSGDTPQNNFAYWAKRSAAYGTNSKKSRKGGVGDKPEVPFPAEWGKSETTPMSTTVAGTALVLDINLESPGGAAAKK